MQDSDGDQRCDPYCFSLKPIGKTDSGDWDALFLEVVMPAKTLSNADPGELLWDLEVPKNAVNEEVWLEVTCASASSYWGSSTFGLTASQAAEYPVNRYHPTLQNEYVNGVTMKVSDYKISLWSQDEYLSTENLKYWVLFPVVTKAVTTTVSALTCTATFKSKNERGY